jgi:uncharacterized membrane protein YgcG
MSKQRDLFAFGGAAEMRNRRSSGWLAGVGVAVLACAPAWASVAVAAPLPNGGVISTGQVTLGVTSDAGLAESGIGLQDVPGGIDGLVAPACGCAAWDISLTGVQTSTTLEAFTSTNSTARSVVRIDDAGGAPILRVTHDFHPAPGSTHLYEVTVTLENLTTATIQPGYGRTLTWAGGPLDPSTLTVEPIPASVQLTASGAALGFSFDMPPIEVGQTHAFRLHLGAGQPLDEAVVGLTANGASLLSHASSGANAFVFGFADGVAPVSTSAGGAAGGGGSGGGGAAGGGGSGGGGGASASGPQPLSQADTSVGGLQSADSPGPQGSSVTAASAPQLAADANSSSPQQPDATNGTGSTSVSESLPGGVSYSGDRDSSAWPNVASTPELDSLALLGSGLVGLAGYALAKRRARRR